MIKYWKATLINWLPQWLSCEESAYNAGDVGLIPELGRFPGKEMVTHSSNLLEKIPWTVEPGGLQSMESQRV